MCTARGLRGEPPSAVRAQLGGVPVAVQHVVDGLEEHAELVAECPPRAPARAHGTPAAQSPSPTAAAKRRPVLSRWSRSSSTPRPGDVEVLPADHPERRADELLRYLGPSRAGRQCERLREERVAGEERHGLPEGDVDARPPPSLGVVVQRGQVVVDERERVDELERRRGERVPLLRPLPAASQTARHSTGRIRLPPPPSA